MATSSSGAAEDRLHCRILRTYAVYAATWLTGRDLGWGQQNGTDRSQPVKRLRGLSLQMVSCDGTRFAGKWPPHRFRGNDVEEPHFFCTKASQTLGGQCAGHDGGKIQI